MVFVVVVGGGGSGGGRNVVAEQGIGVPHTPIPG